MLHLRVDFSKFQDLDFDTRANARGGTRQHVIRAKIGKRNTHQHIRTYHRISNEETSKFDGSPEKDQCLDWPVVCPDAGIGLSKGD